MLARLLPVVIGQLKTPEQPVRSKARPCLSPAPCTGVAVDVRAAARPLARAPRTHATWSAEQVLEILSHVNKRIKGHAAIGLPLDALLDLALAPDSKPLVQNFGLVYAEMACDRAPPGQRWAAVRCPRCGHQPAMARVRAQPAGYLHGACWLVLGCEQAALACNGMTKS